MASYSQIKQKIVENKYDFTEACAYDNCIYLVAQSRNRVETTIVSYIPTFREKGNDWIRITVPCEQLHTTSFHQGGIHFVGAAYGGLYLLKKENVVEGVYGFEAREVPELDYVSHIGVIDNELYVSAQGDKLFKLSGGHQWIDVTDGQIIRRSKQGFISSFDGFSKHEVYLGGYGGEIWLFNDNVWRKLTIPRTGMISNIVCADDGNVYLNAGTEMLVGRKDTWESVDMGGNNIQKIAWFKGELYLLEQSGSLYKLAKNKDSLSVTKGINISPQAMVASDDLLMLIRSDRVVLYDGSNWFNLFDKNKTEEALRATGTFYDPREL